MSIYEKIIKVRKGEMAHLDFLKEMKKIDSFNSWCDSHGVLPDKHNAEFYFDQMYSSDYDESEVLMEIYP